MLLILRVVIEDGIITDGGQDSIEALRSYMHIAVKDLQVADSIFMKEEIHVGCGLFNGLPVIEIMPCIEIPQHIKENLTPCCDWHVF